MGVPNIKHVIIPNDINFAPRNKRRHGSAGFAFCWLWKSHSLISGHIQAVIKNTWDFLGHSNGFGDSTVLIPRKLSLSPFLYLTLLFGLGTDER